MTSNKIRIYDLAKELKLESKRVIEEARREGVDVNVPSNSVSKEVADKIRNKYFPKQETTVQRAVRVIKKRPTEGDEAAYESDTDVHHEHTAVVTPPAPATTSAQAQTSASSKPTAQAAPSPSSGFVNRPMARLVKRAIPPPTSTQPSVEQPAPDADVSTSAVVDAPVIAATPSPEPRIADATPAVSSPEQPEMQATPERAPEVEIQPAPIAPPVMQPVNQRTTSSGTRTLTLRPTAAALNAGIRPGERVSAPPPPPPTPRERMERSGGSSVGTSTPDASRRRGSEARGGSDVRGGNGGRATATAQGTPGETSTPQTTYTPPADSRRKPSARGGRRGAPATAGSGFSPGGRRNDARGGGRFNQDFDTPQRTLTLEERIREGMTSGAVGELKQARIVEGSTVKEFAEKLGIKPKDIVALLLQRGVFATINQPLGDDLAVDLAKRFGYEVSFVPFEEMVTEQEFEELIAMDSDDVELPRAPVVTVMGHVDHGKTSLLDAVRTANVAAGEAGGITQHIGAYSVSVPNPGVPGEMRRVVFLDTPGHEAFTMMRARGAKATDVVVLVVAADDGVMPQTIEAIEHSRAANVPIIVAINKIDKPDANADRVKQELAVQGLQPLDWGGDTETVQVSARNRTNVDVLLETILLTTDILDLKASPTRLASGVVLEAKLDRGRGAVATVLVQQGTLRVGDPFIAGQIYGKVRAMFDDRGKSVTEAAPATPVEVLGLQAVPQAGDSFQVVSDITRAQSISQHRQQLQRQTTLLQSTKRGIEALGEREIKELLVVLKADVQGSVEVLKSTLEKLSTEQVKVKVVRSGAGAITESDVILASATQASASNTAVVIIGFNVRPEVRAAELAKQEDVEIRPHSIIYKVEEEIRAAMIGMLDAIEQEKILGHALVQQVFRVPRAGVIAGCRVLDGTVKRNSSARLVRDGVVVWEGGIASLRRAKDDVAEVREGFECGIALVNFNDVKDGDQIEVFTIERVAATEL